MRIATQHHSERLEEYSATIRRDYGEEVLGITLALCKISDIKLKASKEQASDFRDMIVSYSEDPRVILIKLADRLEVMRSLDLFPEKKRRAAQHMQLVQNTPFQQQRSPRSCDKQPSLWFHGKSRRWTRK